MDIYNILSSKPHNPHYLSRYIRFIDACQQKNEGYVGYTEKHHICPKANDMFPEYACFKDHSWNCAVLTARQHFIAHMILWKTYEISSVSIAFYFMVTKNKRNTNSRFFEKLKIEFNQNIQNKVLARDKNGNVFKIDKEHFEKDDELVGATKGFITAIDKYGNKERMSTDDIRLKTKEFKYISKGMVPVKTNTGDILYVECDDKRIKSGELSYITSNQVTVIDKLGNTFNVNKDDPRYLSEEFSHITKGYVIVKDKFGKTYKVKKDDPRYLSGELKGCAAGKVTVKDKNGKFHSVKKDDPRFLSGELVATNKGIKRQKYECNYCKGMFSKTNLVRWHDENCKKK